MLFFFLSNITAPLLFRILFLVLFQVRDLAHAAAAQAAQAAALHAVSKGVAGPDGTGARGGPAGSGGGGGGGLPGVGCVPRPGRGGASLVPGRGRGRPRKIKKDRKEQQHEGDDQTAKHMQILKKLLDGPGADSASEEKPKVGGGGVGTLFVSLGSCCFVLLFVYDVLRYCCFFVVVSWCVVVCVRGSRQTEVRLCWRLSFTQARRARRHLARVCVCVGFLFAHRLQQVLALIVVRALSRAAVVGLCFL